MKKIKMLFVIFGVFLISFIFTWACLGFMSAEINPFLLEIEQRVGLTLVSICITALFIILFYLNDELHD